MAKTIAEVTKEPTQKYTTKMETSAAFKPRFDPQANRTVDATKDVASLLGSAATKTKQEHAVSVGIAQTMATDHVSALNEEIAFINKQLGPTESRDVAIKRLQGSIASTSGIAAGLAGDAAQAYDQLYIPAARKMATKAMSFWDGQQKDIDKNRMTAEFEKFISNTYVSLDPGSANAMLGVWKARAGMIDPAMASKMEQAAGDATVDHIVKTAREDPTKNPVEVAEKFRNISLFGQVEIGPDGKMTFGTRDIENQAKIATALDAVFDAEQRYLDADAKASTAAYDKEEKRRLSVFKTLSASIDRTTAAGRAEYKKVWEQVFGDMAVPPRGVADSTTSSDAQVADYIVGIESKGRYDVWNGNTTYSRAGQVSPSGAKYSTAYGRYQFIEETAQARWNTAQAEGLIDNGKTMVHGKQTAAEQDAMWTVQLRSLRKSADNMGVPQNNENLYTIHQLGAGGARDYFNNARPSSKTIKDMNDQLPKGQRLGNPMSDPSSVKRMWERKYRRNSTTKAVTYANQNTTKAQAALIAGIAEGQSAEEKAEIEENKSDVEKQDKSVAESMTTMVDSLAKMTDDDPTEENYGKMLDQMFAFNELLESQGKDPMFTQADFISADNIQKVRKLIESRSTAKAMSDMHIKEYAAKVTQDNKNYRDEAENLVQEYKNNPATANAGKIANYMIEANAKNKKLGLDPVFTDGEIEKTAVMDDTRSMEAAIKVGETANEKWEGEQKTMVEEAAKAVKLAMDKMAAFPEDQTFYKNKAIAIMSKVNKEFEANEKGSSPFDLADLAEPKFALSIQKKKELVKNQELMATDAKKKFADELTVRIKKERAILAKLQKKWEGSNNKEDYAALQAKTREFKEYYKDKTTEDPFAGDIEANAIATIVAEDKATRDAAKTMEKVTKADHTKKVTNTISNMEKVISNKIMIANENPTQRVYIKDEMIKANQYATDNNMPLVYSRGQLDGLDSDFQHYDAKKDAALLADAKQSADDIFTHNKDKPHSEVLAEEIAKIKFASEEGTADAARLLNKTKTVEAQTKVRSKYTLAENITKKLDTNKKLEELMKLKPHIDPDAWDNNIQQSIDDYMQSGDKIVEDAIASPTNKEYSISSFKSKKDYDRYLDARFKQMDNLFRKDPRQMQSAYSKQDRKLKVQHKVATKFAAKKVKDVLTDLNELNALVKGHPQLWSNSTFQQDARQGLSGEDNSKLTAMLSIISVMPDQNYDPRLSRTINTAVKAAWEGRAMSDSNGEEVEYTKSDQMDEFTDNVQELLKVPVDERVGLMMTARALDKMGFSDVIPSLWGSLSTKYEEHKELGGRVGSVDRHILMQADNDPAKMAALVATSLRNKNGLSVEDSKGFKQNVLDGEYLLGTNESGITVITFPNKDGLYNMEQQVFVLDNKDYMIDKTEETESKFYIGRDGNKVLKSSRRGRKESKDHVDSIKVRMMTKEEKAKGSVEAKADQDVEWRNRSYADRFRNFFNLEQNIPTYNMGE